MTTTPRTKGQWVGSHTQLAYDALAPIADNWHEADRIIHALSGAGLLVSSAYYVPSLGELYDNWEQMRYAAFAKMKPRWVMCAETWTTLATTYVSQQTTRPLGPLSYNHSEGTLEELAPSPIFVVSVPAGRLFGEEVRFDPAARRPMWEVVE